MHEEFPLLTKSLVAWLDIMEHVARRQVHTPANQLQGAYATFAPKLVDYVAVCRGMLASLLEGQYLGDNSNPFLGCFAAKPGRSITASMRRFGYPIVPPEMVQVRPRPPPAQDGVHFPVSFSDSFVSRWLLRPVYAERRGARTFAKMIKYSRRMLQDVMLACPPTLYHVVIDEYMGLAILEHLCTAGDFNFRASFRLPDDSTYTMVSIHFGGMQVTGGRDSRHWDLSESGCCSQVHALISDMAEVARVSMDHGNEYTVGGGVYGVAGLVEQDVSRRMDLTGRPDQTLAMNLWRAHQLALRNIGWGAQDNSTSFSAVLTPPLLQGDRGTFAQLHRVAGIGQRNEVLTIRKVQGTDEATKMRLTTELERIVADMDGKYRRYLRSALGLTYDDDGLDIEDAVAEAHLMADWIMRRHIVEYLRSLHARWPHKFILIQQGEAALA